MSDSVPAESELPPAKKLSEESAALAVVPAGLPSEILANRPDVLAAEHALLAANANIGAARAAFFPSISLTASGGFGSTELSDLFKGYSKAWSFAPSIYLPIFEGGRLHAQLDVAALQREIEIANYEKAIQTAFREVSDEFAVLNTIAKRVEAQKQVLESQKRRFEIVSENYDAGNATSLQVILAQQDYFAAQQSFLAVYFAEISSKIALYKALGGGWTKEDFVVPAKEKSAVPAGEKSAVLAETSDEDDELAPISCEEMAQQSLEDFE